MRAATAPWGRTLWKALLLAGGGWLLLLGTWTLRVVATSLHPLEATFMGQPLLEPGRTAAFRVLARDRESGQPKGGADLRVALKSPTGPHLFLGAGRTNAQGLLHCNAKVPATLPEGEYQLLVEEGYATHPILQEPMAVKRAFRLLLSTDKPLYQPGQTIRMRVLALASADMKPAQGQELGVEVRDPKGTKVFKQTLTTSDFGLAATEFPLADQVNPGDYTLMATLGTSTSERTVNVGPYVLPKFKVELTSDRTWYAPGERLRADLRAEYTFGKTVAKARVQVEAQEFIDAFRTFATAQGTTDEEGHFHVELPLKATFHGQPLKGGDALVRLQATVTDPGGHTQVKALDLTVSRNPIRVDVIPEGGQLVPGIPNQLHILTSYPDGRPCKAALTLEPGGHKASTSEQGFARVALVPSQEKLTLTAQDATGTRVKVTRHLSMGRGDAFLLRTEKALYRCGERLQVEVLCTAKEDRLYLDGVKDGRTVFMGELEVRQGRGTLALDLPPDLVGTLDLHAYRLDPGGISVRQSRVVQVLPGEGLGIQADLDKATYRPGERAELRLRVTGKDGAPTPAALSLAAVDEAVFALNPSRPGLEGAFFAIQQELLKPRYELHGHLPGAPELLAHPPKESLEALMSAAQGGPEPMVKVGAWDWRAREQETRELQLHGSILVLALFLATLLRPFLQAAPQGFGTMAEPASRTVSIHPFKVWSRMVLGLWWTLAMFSTLALMCLFLYVPWGWRERLVGPLHASPLGALATAAAFFAIFLWLAIKGLQWTEVVRVFPALNRMLGQLSWAYVFACGTAVALAMLGRDFPGWVRFGWLVIVAAFAFTAGPLAACLRGALGPQSRWSLVGRILVHGGLGLLPLGVVLGVSASMGGWSLDGIFGEQPSMAARRVLRKTTGIDLQEAAPQVDLALAMELPTGAGATPPPRIRSHFPETLAWMPQVLTDAQGRATVNLDLADSITTWRVGLSAVGRAGALGSVDKPLRVFQDFFVDLDFPVSLTQHDEVQVPIALYNYLDTPQKVRLEVQPAPWCRLKDGDPREVTLGPREVTSTRLGLVALRPGRHALTVKAFGSVMSDAITREVTVAPDGRPLVQTQGGRLGSGATLKVQLPPEAIPGADDLVLKLYPGAFSQVVEGLEAVFQMPYGCFEQTSSTTYPSVLVLDYLRRTKRINPALSMKAASLINLGYQRLLTFEVPRGGFEWFGRAPAHPVLTAYGLMEFTDMAKVQAVDPDLIQRTRTWLLNQGQAEGMWPSSHGGIQDGAIDASQGNDLRTTAYIVWALGEAGETSARFQRALGWVEAKAVGANDPYTLALCASALRAGGEGCRGPGPPGPTLRSGGGDSGPRPLGIQQHGRDLQPRRHPGH